MSKVRLKFRLGYLSGSNYDNRCFDIVVPLYVQLALAISSNFDDVDNLETPSEASVSVCIKHTLSFRTYRRRKVQVESRPLKFRVEYLLR